MRAVLQRVRRAEVAVDGAVVGRIGPGLLVYVGVGVGDQAEHARRLADKIAGLRIFKDDGDKLNLSVRDVSGGVLAIPNFTLMADARKGRRPTLTPAAPPEVARSLYDEFVGALAGLGAQVATGTFGAHMLITSEADGPVNIVLDMPPQGPPGAEGPEPAAKPRPRSR